MCSLFGSSSFPAFLKRPPRLCPALLRGFGAHSRVRDTRSRGCDAAGGIPVGCVDAEPGAPAVLGPFSSILNSGWMSEGNGRYFRGFQKCDQHVKSPGTGNLASELLARAKRERVVQDGVEKANRRPTDTTRHDTASLTPFSKINNF